MCHWKTRLALLLVCLLFTGLLAPSCALAEEDGQTQQDVKTDEASPDLTPPAPTEAPTEAPVLTGKTAYTLSAYQRAEQPGMYLKIELQGGMQKRVKAKLESYLKENQAEFGTDPASAANKSVSAWITATKSFVGSLYKLKSATEADKDVAITEGYVKAYDFLPIADAEGRTMLYPFEQYDADMYEELCAEATAALNEKITGLLQTTFDNVLGAQEEAHKTYLQQAFDQQIAGSALTVAEARAVFSKDTEITEGMKLGDAVNASSDLTVGNLSGATPIPVAVENTVAAYYKLVMDENVGGLYGEKLEQPVDIATVKLEKGAVLWLNEAGELIYLSASQSWLSADAAQLTTLLGERGGEAQPPKETQPAGISWPLVLMYVFLGIAVLEFAYIVFRRRIALSLRAQGKRAPKKDAAIKPSDPNTKES